MATPERRRPWALGPIPWIALTGLALAAALAAVAPDPGALFGATSPDEEPDPAPRPVAHGSGAGAGAGAVSSRPVDPASAARTVDPAAWRWAFERLREAEAEGTARGEPSDPWLAELDGRLAAADRRLASMAGEGAARARGSLARVRGAVASASALGPREVAP